MYVSACVCMYVYIYIYVLPLDDTSLLLFQVLQILIEFDIFRKYVHRWELFIRIIYI